MGCAYVDAWNWGILEDLVHFTVEVCYTILDSVSLIFLQFRSCVRSNVFARNEIRALPFRPFMI